MSSPATSALEGRIEGLLAAAEPGDPAVLRAALAELYQAYGDQQRQFQKLTRISDRYQAVARESSQAMGERFSKQLRHLEKITRLSDRYQKMLRDLNEALAEASTHDALTGLPNRRRMTERLRETHALQQRTGLSWCVAMLDVDHFKKVNDTHGHDAGDVVLVQVSRVLQAGLRGSDACARWGGEEFMVLLTDTQLGAATEVLNRLRESIASRDVVANGEVLRVTASLGVAQGRRGEPYSEALKRADEALYRAKRSGRNRVECEADAAAER